MFLASASRLFSQGARAMSTGGKKVAVLGAAGGIGQPLSLLLKNNDHISHLSLYDVVNTPGVASDISHCNTPTKVSGHVGNDQLEAALRGCEVVVIPAGVPRKPGMTRDDLFNTNASIVHTLAAACGRVRFSMLYANTRL
jgi:malate dehydrogenase